MSTQLLQQTLEQRRAKRAWENVRGVMNESDDFKKKYGSLARKVPMLVLTNGLGQTLAFLLSKAKRQEPENQRSLEAKVHETLFQHVSQWVLEQVASDSSNENLLKWVLGNDSAAYRRATMEALAFLIWLKRFAESELPTEED